jgi:hypothetical protein
MSEENTSDPFAGSFMKPHIEHGDYFAVDTSSGTEIVPCDVCGYAGSAEAQDLRDYLEGKPDSADELVRSKTGWLARMSAPGYLDCTDWTAHETEDEARAYLIEHYADDAS